MATAAKPFLRFVHSKALRVKTLKVLDAIDQEEDPTPHRDALAENVMELTNAGFQYFFLDSVAALKMGFVATQTTSLGTSSVLSIMGAMVRKIIGQMDAKQLCKVSKIMRGMMK